MSQVPNPFNAFGAQPQPLQYESGADTITVPAFFNTVYAWMATGLALTAVIAYVVSNNPSLMHTLFQSGIIWLLFIAQIGLVIAISAAVKKISSGVATVMFLVYAALNGLTLSVIFMAYTQASIAAAFFVTGGTFAAMSVYGFVTKRDLTALGSMMFMALIGLIIASVVNIFWANSSLDWIITYAGVLIFVGLTAYDTQKLKYIAMQTGHDREMSNRMAVNGALVLYLDFINLFLMILRIMGKRR